MNFISQLLAMHLFSATPIFAGWIVNGGRREDVVIPIVGSFVFPYNIAFASFS